MKASESGGQRARINLARALYSDADLYLLDDPLAAVDTKVVNNLYHNAITNQLGDKTRILVTHHVSLLRNADVIICINNKQIVFNGTFDEMKMSNDSYLIEMMSREFKPDQTGTNRNKKAETISETNIDEAEVMVDETKKTGQLGWQYLGQGFMNRLDQSVRIM